MAASFISQQQPKLCSDLDISVINGVCMRLNPHLMNKDYETLAGKMGFKYYEIRNFGRQTNPTGAVLESWWSQKGDRSVNQLISILKKIERYDVVGILEKQRFVVVNTESQPSIDENPSQPDSSFGSLALNDAVQRQKAEPREFEYDFDSYDNELPFTSQVFQGPPVFNPCKQRSNFNAIGIVNGHHGIDIDTDGTALPIDHPSPIDHIMPPMNSVKPRLNLEINPDMRKNMDISNGFSKRRSNNDTVTNGPSHSTEIVGAQKRGKNQGGTLDMLYSASVVTPSPHLSKLPRMISAETQVSPMIGFDAPIFPSPTTSDLVAPVGDKVALVIGNAEYLNAGIDGLYYSRTDALDVSQALTELGFKVLTLVNLNLTEMRTAMLAFCRLLGDGVYAVFYYAGHGYEEGGENYLMPIDATINYNPNESIRAQEFLQEMQSCNTLLNLIIIDACRTKIPVSEPATCKLKRGTKGNTIMAYSCCSQHVAFEEPNQRNGLYARHLLKDIRKDTRIENILMDVNAAVSKNFTVTQRPTFESDAFTECRLTAKIVNNVHGSNADVYKIMFNERTNLWQSGRQTPNDVQFRCDNFDGSLSFGLPRYGNILEFKITLKSTVRTTLENITFKIDVYQPMKPYQQQERDTLQPHEIADIGFVTIGNIQKLRETLLIRIAFQFDINGFQNEGFVKIDLGFPLVSAITADFQKWITEKTMYPEGVKSTWT